MPMTPVTPFTPVGQLRPGQYYRHSGGLNPAGLLAALAAGTAAALAIGFAYAYVDKYIPEVHLNALACGVAGAAIGGVPAAILRRAKVRHLPAALLVIGLVAVAGLYASWVTWEAILTQGGLANLRMLATHPAAVGRFAVRINAVGTWAIGSTSSSSGNTNTSGAFLWVIWAAEAAMLVGVPLMVGKSMLSSKPFCDGCDRWCDGPTVVRATGVPAGGDVADVRRRLEAADFAYPATLGPPSATDRLTFARHGCDRCGKLNTLTVSRKTIRVDRKGRARQATTKVLVNKLLVSREDLARLAPPPVTPAAAKS